MTLTNVVAIAYAYAAGERLILDRPVLSLRRVSLPEGEIPRELRNRQYATARRAFPVLIYDCARFAGNA